MDSLTSEELEEIKAIEIWINLPRFDNIIREYTSYDIWKMRSKYKNSYVSNEMSKKLYNILLMCKKNKTCTYTFGCLDPVQLIHMTPYVETIYVSGWQCASTASTNNEPGPDVADYPMDTVPNKVDQLFRTQEFHSRKQKIHNLNTNDNINIDYYRPMIADADTGHGGISAVMKLTKMFIENGAAGIHIEDQKAGTKKCGHMGGKVLVSTQEHVKRLKAIRLQADIMNSQLIIIARTDAVSAKYIDSNYDDIDKKYILGKLRYDIDNNGNYTKEKECLFSEAVEFIARRNINKNTEIHTDIYNKHIMNILNNLYEPFDWDWNLCRSIEGYYKVKNGFEYASARLLEYCKYSDMLWCETNTPNLEKATWLSKKILSKYPNMFLSYNLSPSFNWSNTNMNDNDLKTFIINLGKVGYVWQFITLAGFHLNGLASQCFSELYQKDGILAYVRDIQNKEIYKKMPLVKHQQWSGSEVLDEVLNIINSGKSCSTISTDGSTEKQFS